MTFALTPAPGDSAAFAVAPGAAAAPGFSVAGADREPREPLDGFMQWQLGGVDLGDKQVSVVDFEGDGLGVSRGIGANSHVLTIRLNVQYLVLTSFIYPVVTSEAVDVSHALTGGSLVPWPLENVDLVHALTGGALVQVLLRYEEWPVESVDVEHSLFGGELVVFAPALEYEMDAEGVDVAHALTAGSIQNVLLTYLDYPVENVEVTHALTGGTLS